MPSASMYASPYTHKEPPPKIHYPGMFSCFSKLTFRYTFDSKILALCTLLLAMAFFVIFLMVIMPFWFELKFDPIDGTFGSKPVKTGLTLNTGIFFMDEDHFTNLIFLDKFHNQDVVPKIMAFAQVCCVFGTCLLFTCFAASVIFMFRRFASATGIIFLAGGTTLAAVLHLLSILACGIMVAYSNCEPDSDGCTYKDNLSWHMIPIHSQMFRFTPEVTPYMAANWAFYIAAIGCILAIAAAVMLWIEALITVKNLTGIRYQQLREVRDPYANDINPYEGKKYVYAPPQRYGPHSYGMQPVVYSSQAYHPYEPQVGFKEAPAAPHIGFVGGPSQPVYRPGSESGSSYPGVETREIDL